MKRYLTMLCGAIFLVINAKAQETYIYKIEYNMMLNFDGYKKYSADLYFNSNSAVFNYHNDTIIGQNVAQEEEDDQIISFAVNDSSQYFIESNKIQNKILQLEKGFEGEKFYLVEEELPPINWTIAETTKKISSYTCHMATGYFAGRNYIAWFTIEVPGFFGPWKFHGLPGIILEISDDLNEVQFFATKVSTVELPLQDVENEGQFKVITREEYVEKLNLFVDDLGQKINSKIGRGYKVKMQTPKIRTIEIYEN